MFKVFAPKLYRVLLLLLICSQSANGSSHIRWTILLEKEHTGFVVGTFENDLKTPVEFRKNIDGILVSAKITPQNGQTRFTATATSGKLVACLFAIRANYQIGDIYSYLGKEKGEIRYRQGADQPNNDKFNEFKVQDLPMIAVKDRSGFTAAVNDSPAFYDNYTTQYLNPKAKQATLSSGYNGEVLPVGTARSHMVPYYHVIMPGTAHTYCGIIFRSPAANTPDLRRDMLFAIAKRWGHVGNRDKAINWARRYMLLN